MKLEFKQHMTNHLVKGEDLNHHGTLFAGRCAEWTVEAGFISVAYMLNPQRIVCLNLHGMEFMYPVRAGSIISFTSQIVRTGKSTITVYVEVHDSRNEGIVTSNGYITFCYVDEFTRAQPHGLVYEPKTEREKELNAVAVELNRRK